MARRKSLERQLDDLAGTFIPKIRKAFTGAIRGVKNDVQLAAIIDAIREGDLEAAFRATGLSQAAMRPITAMIEQAFEAGGVTTAESFRASNERRMRAAGRTVFRFDVRNSRSEAWLREHSSSLVTRVTDDTRQAIRELIEAGVREGRNPRNIALDIAGRVVDGRRVGGIIGLTEQSAKAVTKARLELEALDPAYLQRKQRDGRFDNIVRKAIKLGKPLTAEKVRALTDRYSDNLLLLRGETIARTEALQSLNRSADDAFRQATQDGTINDQMVTKIWDATGDLRTRHTHLVMEGQAVQMNEPFTTPFGAKLMFPGDSSLGAPASEIINCRCRVKYKVDWLSDLDDDPVPVKPKPVPKPLPPAETPAERNARLMNEQNDYVIGLGRSTGVEHLSAIDEATGEVLGRNVGTKGNVKFTPEFQSAIMDPSRRILATHNHPSSRSFSDQDLNVIATAPGLRGLYAIGHNGSKYYAEVGSKGLTETAVKMQSRSVVQQIGYDIRRVEDADARKTFLADVNLIGNHIIMLILNGKKRINYTAELSGETAAAAERQREYIETMVKGYLKK